MITIVSSIDIKTEQKLKRYLILKIIFAEKSSKKNSEWKQNADKVVNVEMISISLLEWTFQELHDKYQISTAMVM